MMLDALYLEKLVVNDEQFTRRHEGVYLLPKILHMQRAK